MFLCVCVLPFYFCFCCACLALGVVPSTTPAQIYSAHVSLQVSLLKPLDISCWWALAEKMCIKGKLERGSPIIQSQALSCASFSLVLLQPSWRKFSMNFAALQFVFFSTLLRSFFASHFPLYFTPLHTHSTRLDSTLFASVCSSSQVWRRRRRRRRSWP